MTPESNRKISLSKNGDGAAENSNQSCIEVNKDDHIVGDEDYANLIGILRILARQLELSLEEGNTDYHTITDFCLFAGKNSKGKSVEFGRRKKEVIKALQYYDRASQRVVHVSESLKLLASNLMGEDWSHINMDLTQELKKTDSFYNEVQTKQLSDLAKGHCEVDSNYIHQNEQRSDRDDDNVEFF